MVAGPLQPPPKDYYVSHQRAYQQDQRENDSDQPPGNHPKTNVGFHGYIALPVVIDHHQVGGVMPEAQAISMTEVPLKRSNRLAVFVDYRRITIVFDYVNRKTIAPVGRKEPG